MDWKKLLPEGPFFLFAVIGFLVAGYALLEQDLGSTLWYHLSIAVGVYTAFRLYKKFKTLSTPTQ